MRRESTLPLRHGDSLFESMRQFCFSSFYSDNRFRLWPIATSKISSLTEFMPLRTILLYQWSFFMILKVPSACIERFIRNSASWILSRFSITSWCMEVRFFCVRTFTAIFTFIQFFLASVLISPYTLFLHKRWNALSLGPLMTPCSSILKLTSRNGFSWYFWSLVSFLNIGNFIYFSIPFCSQKI